MNLCLSNTIHKYSAPKACPSDKTNIGLILKD